MNKQLINKYKLEFDHWLNDGKILYKHINSNAWWNEEPWDYSPDYVTAIIINDEYSEFRKALTEDKIIQIYDVIEQHPSDRTFDKFGWRDFKSFTASSPFSKATDLYRIKPDEPNLKIPAYFKELYSGIVVKFTEEISNSCFGIIVESSLQTPQKNKGFEWRCWDIFSHPERWEYLPNYNEPKFKVGDFVRYVHSTRARALEINNINGNRYYFTNSKMSCLKHELEPWTPVKDEWCWFWDKCTPHRPTLRQYDIFPEGYGEENMFHDSEQNPFDFCEPFLNSLPSYLKDK